MSYWDLDDGTSAATGEKEYTASAGDFEPIPKNTNCLVIVDDASWKEAYQASETFVNLKAKVLKPEAYENRTLFFKLWIDDLDPGVKTDGKFDRDKAVTKRDKHKRMLMTIDANAKGRLAKMTARPSNEQLALALVGSQFVATLGVWDKTEGDKKVPGGNWLMAAKPRTAEVTQANKPAAKVTRSFATDLDDDVPF